MDKTSLAIATVAWARNPDEEALLLTSLTELSQQGIPVYLTDGGSPEGFVDQVQRLPQVFFFREKGLWPQAKKSLTEAHRSGAKTIFYTEPDKLDFFIHHLSSFLGNCRWEEQTGVVLASRSARAFASFPAFQQMTETTINRCCKEIVGLEADFCYGPFLFRADIIGALEAIPQSIGWGWRPYLFAKAHRLGFTVGASEGDFLCSSDQQTENSGERIYRMKQLAQNLEGLVLATAVNANEQ